MVMMKNTIQHHTKQLIQLAIRNVREARKDRRTPCLMGMGWTIATRDGLRQICKLDGGKFNFSATWNRGSVYWTRSVAEENLKLLKQDNPVAFGSMEVMHHNDLRDAQCKCNEVMLSALFPKRHLGA